MTKGSFYCQEEELKRKTGSRIRWMQGALGSFNKSKHEWMKEGSIQEGGSYVQGIASFGWNVIKIVGMVKWVIDVMQWWLVGE